MSSAAEMEPNANTTQTDTSPPKVSIDFNEIFDTSNLQGRSVLVTGGAAGIGLACARKLAEAGAIVTISDLQHDVGTSVVQDMLGQGHKVQFVPCDVTSYAAQVDMFEKAIRFGGGKIDIVIPNAGIMAERSLFDMIPAAAPALESPPPTEPTCMGLDVNLRAVYNTCFLALHYFRLSRGTSNAFKPSIIFIASLAGYIGYPSSSTYSISKFGIRGLFHSIRDRATREGVRVNLVAPWYVETAMTTRPEFLNSESGALLKYTGYAPMGRLVDAVMRFSADENLYGRAAGIFLAGNEDLGDDLDGAYSGIVLQKHIGEAMKMVVKAITEESEKAQDAQQEIAVDELVRTDSGNEMTT